MHNPHIIRRLKYRINYYKGPPRHRNIHRSFLIIILIGALTLFSFYKIEKRLFSLGERIAFSCLKNEISDECNRCIEEIVKKNNIDLSAIISSSNTENEKLPTLSADYSELNLLKTEVGNRLSPYMENLRYIDCKIPSGSLFSDGIFAGYGFNIPIRFIASGSADVDFTDEFISSGINHTKYRLAIRITVTADVQTVFNQREYTFTTEIPLTEKIIVGDVPNLMFGL